IASRPSIFFENQGIANLALMEIVGVGRGCFAVQRYGRRGGEKILACCDDDDDYNSAITPNEPVDSLNMGGEHLNTIPAMESDEFIKSIVENLVPNPSESEGENGCDVPACFTTFSNILFDADYEFDSSNDQSCSDEDIPEKIFSNPLFEEEIIPMKIDQHHFNAESDLIESLFNHDSSIIPSSSKINSLLDEFAGELTLLKSIPPGVDETNCYPEEDIHLIERLLYDNSSPRPTKEFISGNSNADIESFSSSPIPVKDSDSFIEEIDLPFTSDDPMPSGIEEDDYDSERDILIREELLDNYSLSLPVIESYHFDITSFSRPPAKPPDADDQAIQTILLGLSEDIYAAVDSRETAQEIWLCVQQMMKGFDIGIQEKKAKLFNEWERFTSTDGESIESYYNCFSKLMNDFKRNKHFLEKIASVQNVRNHNGLIVVSGIANQNPNGNGNVVAARAKGNVTGNNGNQIRCYNCRGLGHFTRNCTVKPRRRDVAYLQTQLLIA
nr:hypothetical protein [Tanacetum cinerariifolium]